MRFLLLNISRGKEAVLPDVATYLLIGFDGCH